MRDDDEDGFRPPPDWPNSVRVAQACAQLLRQHRLGRLLDAGGGAGLLTGYLMSSRVVDAALVLDAREAPLALVPAPAMTKHGRLEELSDVDGEFSTILLRQVLHYVESPERALRLLRDRLRPAGALYVGQIVAPDQNSARWLGRMANWVSPARHRVWTAEKLLVAFTQAGLRVRRATVAPHWQTLDDRARPEVGSLSAWDRRTMPVQLHQGTVCCRLYWVHALLVPESAPGGSGEDDGRRIGDGA